MVGMQMCDDQKVDLFNCLSAQVVGCAAPLGAGMRRYVRATAIHQQGKDGLMPPELPDQDRVAVADVDKIKPQQGKAAPYAGGDSFGGGRFFPLPSPVLLR